MGTELSYSTPFRNINALADFQAFVAELAQPNANGIKRFFAFRGQSRTWNVITPTFFRLARGLPLDELRNIEARLLGEFRTRYTKVHGAYPGWPEPQTIGPGNDFKCLSLMEQYGAPTRLLDWTTSPWVAAYFACASDSDSDGELWFYNRAVMGLNQPASASLMRPEYQHMPEPEYLGTHFDMPELIEVSYLVGDRIRSQEGHHTFDMIFREPDHAIQLARMASIATNLGSPGPQFGRVLIAEGCKRVVLAHLAEQHDIRAATLFPDLFGLGMELNWSLRST